MKTHLLDSSEPITEGLTQTAICGAEIKDAVFVAQSDDGASAESVIQSASCYRCKKLASELTKKYLYLITAGQEKVDAGGGAGEITQCC